MVHSSPVEETLLLWNGLSRIGSTGSDFDAPLPVQLPGNRLHCTAERYGTVDRLASPPRTLASKHLFISFLEQLTPGFLFCEFWFLGYEFGDRDGCLIPWTVPGSCCAGTIIVGVPNFSDRRKALD
jgi:hypothetical protein